MHICTTYICIYCLNPHLSVRVAVSTARPPPPPLCRNDGRAVTLVGWRWRRRFAATQRAVPFSPFELNNKLQYFLFYSRPPHPLIHSLRGIHSHTFTHTRDSESFRPFGYLYCTNSSKTCAHTCCPCAAPNPPNSQNEQAWRNTHSHTHTHT